MTYGAPEISDTSCWAAVAELGPYYLALEWRRGEPAPLLQHHVARVRAAREHFEVRLQTDQGADLHEQALLVVEAPDMVGRWVALFHRHSGFCDPLCAWNDYIQ